MFVKFNDPEEFIAEMALVSPRPLLRLTIRRRFGTDFVSWTILGSVLLSDGLVLRLEHYLGTGYPHEHATFAAQADAVITRLKKAASERGIEVRGGVIE